MANRYWVGGTADWDGTAGTKWSATSGGAGGASVPTTADDVFFDAASGTGTVTVTTSVNAASINFTGFTGTLAGTGQISVLGGSGKVVTLASGMTWTHGGTLRLDGQCTLTTAGKTISTLNVSGFNGNGVITLGDALTVSTALDVQRGTFTTNNFNVTCVSFLSNSTQSRAINLGSSTVTVSGNLIWQNTGTLTVNAGTSQINLTGASASLSAPSVTFNNVSFTTGAIGPRTIGSLDGAMTFSNLTLTSSGVLWRALLSRLRPHAQVTAAATAASPSQRPRRSIALAQTPHGLGRIRGHLHQTALATTTTSLWRRTLPSSTTALR